MLGHGPGRGRRPPMEVLVDLLKLSDVIIGYLIDSLSKALDLDVCGPSLRHYLCFHLLHSFLRNICPNFWLAPVGVQPPADTDAL